MGTGTGMGTARHATAWRGNRSESACGPACEVAYGCGCDYRTMAEDGPPIRWYWFFIAAFGRAREIGRGLVEASSAACVSVGSEKTTTDNNMAEDGP